VHYTVLLTLRIKNRDFIGVINVQEADPNRSKLIVNITHILNSNNNFTSDVWMLDSFKI
jgi:hypothetical protein